MDRDELAARLSRGDHEFLRHVDFSSSADSGVNMGDARRLGDEAFHMLGLSYADLDLPRTSERFLRLSWMESPEPWRRESLMALLELLESEQRYGDLVRVARDGASRYRNDPAVDRFLASGLYRLQRDAELLAVLNRFPEISLESALWLAVAGSRLQLPGWEEQYRNLFARHSADDIHSRMWVYILANPHTALHFTARELLFFRAKQLLADGRTVDAVELFEQVADQVISEAAGQSGPVLDMLFSPASLRDFYIAGSQSGRQSATAARLTSLATIADGQDDFGTETAALAREYAGRLYRTAGNYVAAIERFELSLSGVPPGINRERVMWYLLSSQGRADPIRVAESLPSVLTTLGDSDYYSDLFTELARRLAELQRWETIRAAYEALRGFATSGTLATYELILADAVALGLLSTEAGQGASLRTSYLQEAASQTENLFAALVATAALGESGESLLLSAVARETTDSDMRAAGIVQAMVAYGLLDHAYATALGGGSSVPADILIELADALASAGRIRESIRIAEIVRLPATSGDLSLPETEELLRRVYPLGFAAVFDEALTDDTDRWLLYGMVREESRFDPTAESVDGAVGLTQLLPETAEDVAGRMRLDQYDLADPFQNLQIGARYLAMLESQFGGVVKALAAYNAGQGRVRSWERLRPELDGVLFHQSIPFDETYNHIRSVVVSAAYYGYVYEGRSPAEIVRTVFGDSLIVSEE